MTADSKYYYAVSLTGFINAWAIERNGDLTPIQQVGGLLSGLLGGGLPLNIAGLAVR
jgi:hypothetical protein